MLDDGRDEDQAVAALLHDAVEDGGGRPMLDRIRVEFGDEVAKIVETRSDSLDPRTHAPGATARPAISPTGQT